MFFTCFAYLTFSFCLFDEYFMFSCDGVNLLRILSESHCLQFIELVVVTNLIYQLFKFFST